MLTNHNLCLLTNSNKSRGFSLIEIMIALLINGILLIIVIKFFSLKSSNYSDTVQMNKLNEQLQSIMFIMTNDIMRAGYWNGSTNDLGKSQNTNPFMANGTDLSIPNSKCILFSYDRNNNSGLPAISTTTDDERYGYRLSNQIIQARPRGQPFSCSTSFNLWDNVTDPSVVIINNLVFTLSQTVINSTNKPMTIRNVHITITGSIPNNSNITKTINGTVKIRNDKYS